MLKYRIHTLGCKLNYAESSTIARGLERRGYHKAETGEVANLVIINSCSVTSEADRKAREVIRRAVRENPQAEVVVTGCYAKLKADEIAMIEGVTRVESDKSILLATSSPSPAPRPKSQVPFFPSYSLGERTRSFLKVQDGCDYHCSYCTVWRARGESRNAPVADIVAAAREIADTGAREIVLTGVNIGDFGRSTEETFFELIQALAGVEKIDRYRISSIEPNLLTNEIIEFCAANEKFMPHFHIPLQSGCDSVLRKMGRRYTTDFFATKIAYVRSLIPHAFIGIDVIVGFPGETDDDFKTTLTFLKDIRPSYLHIFPYSARDNTMAAAMVDQVPGAIKKQRMAQLEALNETLQSEFAGRELQRSHLVLVEGRDKATGRLFGHTENYLRVEIDGHDELINSIIEFK